MLDRGRGVDGVGGPGIARHGEFGEDKGDRVLADQAEPASDGVPSNFSSSDNNDAPSSSSPPQVCQSHASRSLAKMDRVEGRQMSTIYVSNLRIGINTLGYFLWNFRGNRSNFVGEGEGERSCGSHRRGATGDAEVWPQESQTHHGKPIGTPISSQDRYIQIFEKVMSFDITGMHRIIRSPSV